MSRSYRKYMGLPHGTMKVDNHTHIVNPAEKGRRALRAKLKDKYHEFAPIGKKCHKNNCYDGMLLDEKVVMRLVAGRPQGTNPLRVVHKLKGK